MKASEMAALITRAENIKRVTNKFGKDTAKAAAWVALKMDEAGINQLEYEGGTLEQRRVRSSVGSDDVLSFSSSDYYDTPGDLLGKTIEADDGYYLHGDFNCWIQHKTRDEAVEFARALPEIIKAIAELDQVPGVAKVD